MAPAGMRIVIVSWKGKDYHYNIGDETANPEFAPRRGGRAEGIRGH